MNKTLHQIYVASFILISVMVTFFLAYNGYHYYSTPLDQRFFLPQNNMLKPSGIIGHGLGIIGSLMMIVGVGVYMIRKRVRAFFGLGYLKNWLEFHIFLCTLGPILVLYHTAFKFGGIVAVSFWSMTAVVLSGVVGRFIYVQIPRSIKGQVIELKDLEEINSGFNERLIKDFKVDKVLIDKLEEHSRLDRHTRITSLKSIGILMGSYFHIKTILKNLKRELKKNNRRKDEVKEILQTAKSKLIMSRRIGMLQTMQKFFRYWHIVHLPFAIAMFVIMFVHIAVTIVFGYRWIF